MSRDEGLLLGVIGDEDTVTGFLLAGIGHKDRRGTNYLVVDSKTKVSDIEAKFVELTERDDLGVVLINQHVAATIRHVIAAYSKTVPTVLEIPSKEHRYDPRADPIMNRVLRLLGEGDG